MNDQIRRSIETLFLTIITIFIIWLLLNSWNQMWLVITDLFSSSIDDAREWLIQNIGKKMLDSI
jgi:hypothetical protein